MQSISFRVRESLKGQHTLPRGSAPRIRPTRAHSTLEHTGAAAAGFKPTTESSAAADPGSATGSQHLRGATWLKQMATKANISEFAYFPPPPGASRSWSDRFQLPELARLLLDNEQDWKSVDEYGVEDKYVALCKYVQYSFAYIVETQPHKLKCSADDQWVVFNTRLTSSFELLLEPVLTKGHQNAAACSYAARSARSGQR
jgi:hypothetical protein